nr:syntaxin-121-like [Malus domestica]
MVLLNSNVGKGLRSRMDEYFYIALETAKVLKLQLDALHLSNQSLPDCRLGSVMDQTRNSAINCLREKLVASMNSYNAMREWETFMQKATQEQEMRSQVLATVHDLDTFKEFQKRHDPIKHIEKNLQELHQVYLDMALLVESQGEQLRNESDEPKQRKTPATELRGVNNGKKKLRGVKSYRKNIRGLRWFTLSR